MTRRTFVYVHRHQGSRLRMFLHCENHVSVSPSSDQCNNEAATRGFPGVNAVASWLLQVGFSGEGKLKGLDVELYNNAGNSLDLTSSIMDRALLHLDNGYGLGAVRAVGHCCFTNQASNTAFRGFGGPQARPVGLASQSSACGGLVATCSLCACQWLSYIGVQLDITRVTHI